MHKLLLVLFAMLPGLGAFAQQRIVNGDFELMTSCPLEPGDLYLANGWHTLAGTPDFLHKCAELQHRDVNALGNFVGYRNPYSGQGCVGMYALYYNKLMDLKDSYESNEAIYTQLAKPLEAGKKYLFSFYISAADSSNLTVDSLYVTFTKELPRLTNNKFLLKKNTKGLPVNNTKKWEKLQIEIFPIEPISYLSIMLPRNKIPFPAYKNTVIKALDNKTLLRNSTLIAYYYLDLISVVESEVK